MIDADKESRNSSSRLPLCLCICLCLCLCVSSPATTARLSAFFALKVPGPRPSCLLPLIPGIAPPRRLGGRVIRPPVSLNHSQAYPDGAHPQSLFTPFPPHGQGPFRDTPPLPCLGHFRSFPSRLSPETSGKCINPWTWRRLSSLHTCRIHKGLVLEFRRGES